LKRLDKHLTSIEELQPGTILCEVPDAASLMQRATKEHPTLVRHLAPVQTIVDLHNEERDIATIATALVALPSFALLERGTRFAVQSRFTQTDKSKSQGQRPYSSGRLNQMLAEAIAEETETTEAIKKPQVIISILCTMQKGYLGISSAEENLSSWPGGARHFAHTAEEISRAEFKLLEALEVFDITLPSKGRALDLGAAPGGWTRLLLESGLHVVAVDPANLDARLRKHPRLDHYHGYAENYLEEALKKRYKFDVIVNDMRMDAREAARLLARAANCLRPDGLIISVFKLPHATDEINPLATLSSALNIVSTRYDTIQARQLFHNRQEATAVAAHPRPMRT
jgi:23S rRNA (cytidine2498-2'-O)-methyltransferase